MPRLTSKKNATINKRRKGVLAKLVPWAQRSGVMILPAALMIWLIIWLVMGGQAQQISDWTHAKFAEITANNGFGVKDILVEGRTYAQTETIMALINMQKKDPLVDFNPHEAKDQIEKMAWVKSAHVERRWPNTIFIRLNEHKPFALYKTNNKIVLLNQDGEIINTDHLERFSDLITVSGKNAQSQAGAILKNIKSFKEIYSRTATAQYISLRRWDILLKNGIKIMLPETKINHALTKLINAHKDTDILDKDIQHIDLRDPSRMMIRTKPGQVQNYKASFKAGNHI